MYHRLYTKPGSPLKQPALFLNPEKIIRIPLLLHSDFPIWALFLQMDQIQFTIVNLVSIGQAKSHPVDILPEMPLLLLLLLLLLL